MMKARRSHKKELYKKLFLGNLDKDDINIEKELKQDIEGSITKIKGQIDQLSNNTYNWIEQSSNLLNIAKQAKDLFKEANIDQKRQLLDFVSSNRVIADGKLSFIYNKPFNLAENLI